MVRIEDQTVLRPEQIVGSNCPICGEVIDWGRDGESYIALHCDRTMSAEPELYRVTMKKLTEDNIDAALAANTEKGSADGVDKELVGELKSDENEESEESEGLNEGLASDKGLEFGDEEVGEESTEEETLEDSSLSDEEEEEKVEEKPFGRKRGFFG